MSKRCRKAQPKIKAKDKTGVDLPYYIIMLAAYSSQKWSPSIAETFPWNKRQWRIHTYHIHTVINEKILQLTNIWYIQILHQRIIWQYLGKGQDKRSIANFKVCCTSIHKISKYMNSYLVCLSQSKHGQLLQLKNLIRNQLWKATSNTCLMMFICKNNKEREPHDYM